MKGYSALAEITSLVRLFQICGEAAWKLTVWQVEPLVVIASRAECWSTKHISDIEEWARFKVWCHAELCNFVYQQATTGCIKKLLTHSETRSRWRLMRASVMCSQYPWPWISCATAFIVSPIEDDAVDRLEDQPALHYRSQVRNAPDLPPSFGVWLLVLSSESEIVYTYRQSAMIWWFVLCICISRSQLSLYPNCSDAKFQITFIPTRLTVFECHFHNSY